MGMANQGMKLPTTGTTTTPNGRTFNTNPAANQMMADRARMAREQRMQPAPLMSQPAPLISNRPAGMSPLGSQQTMPYGMPPSAQGMGQIGGYNPPAPPNMAQYEAMQKDIAKQREASMAQNTAPVSGREYQEQLRTQTSLPTTGTMTAPNGRVFNTNPAANQMMAQMAAAAKSNPQQLAQGLQQQALIQNQMPRG